ncbi:MAG TPA: carbonic anhydrase [Saprospiraceae bacterium]|nr:carbonic anhydrase [Saprospiraceae bacterium]
MAKNSLRSNSAALKTVLFALVVWSLLNGCTARSGHNQTPPATALEQLQSGNSRFVHHHARHPHQSAARITETAGGQKPYAVVITCSDSRVSPEIIFDQGIGDLFVIRNAGNIVEEEDVLASVEYVVEHLGVHTVVVMGHEHCGAIEAMIHATQEDEPEHVIAILQRLKSEPEEQQALQSGDTGNPLVHRCVTANVEHGVAALNQQLGHLKGHDSEAGLTIIGAVYDIQTGIVHFQETQPPLH